MTEEGDKIIWARYTQGVRRDTRPKPIVAGQSKIEPAQRRTGLIFDPHQAFTPPPESRPFLPNTAIASKKTQRAWRKGRVEVEATLDLHGLTRAKAYARLGRFVEEAVLRGHSTILVITGKGRWSPDTEPAQAEPSVLRASLPAWCAADPLRKIIRHISPAAPCHGGTGAFYLFLG